MKYARACEIEGFKASSPYERTLKVLLSPDMEGAKKVSVGLSLIPKGGRSSPHSHDNEEEIWYVLRGHGRIIVGDEEILAESDTIVYVPPGFIHQLVNTSDENFEVLWIFSPPGPEKVFVGKKRGKA